MRRILLAGVILFSAAPARAEAPSILGGKLLPSGESGHHFGVGLPSTYWEWWNGADQFDWALHLGLVYEGWPVFIHGDDLKIGMDVEVPMRFHLMRRGPTDVAFRFAPGVLLGDVGAGPDDHFALGIKPEAGVLVGIELGRMVNLVTGGTVPFTLYLVPDARDEVFFAIPLLPRLGVEVQPIDSLVAWALMEMGPTVVTGQGQTDVDAGVRFWIGVTWYP